MVAMTVQALLGALVMLSLSRGADAASACVQTSSSQYTCTYNRNSGMSTLTIPAGFDATYTLLGGAGATTADCDIVLTAQAALPPRSAPPLRESAGMQRTCWARSPPPHRP